MQMLLSAEQKRQWSQLQKKQASMSIERTHGQKEYSMPKNFNSLIPKSVWSYFIREESNAGPKSGYCNNKIKESKQETFIVGHPTINVCCWFVFAHVNETDLTTMTMKQSDSFLHGKFPDHYSPPPLLSHGVIRQRNRPFGPPRPCRPRYLPIFRICSMSL